MFKGIALALTACFIWGTIFVVPEFMVGFSSIEVALSRYTFFGIVSLAIFGKDKLFGLCKYPLSIWICGIYFSLITTIVYYTALVLSVRYSTPAICALIVGLSPIAIAFYGNWKEREVSFKSLIVPSVMILIGLVMINAPHLLKTEAVSNYLLGLLAGVVALLAWSWFVVANSKFLRDNPTLLAKDWSTINGVMTIFWVLFCGGLLFLFFPEMLQLEKYTFNHPQFINFLMGGAFLGLFCSWIASFLWNRASVYLPVSLAGQLTIFETIFGVIFVYTIAQEVPPLLECVGIALLLAAVILGIRQSTSATPQHVS